jgi:hypothetical protein
MTLDSASPEGRALTALMELPDDAAARLAGQGGAGRRGWGLRA